jgi:hypothetical protein
MKFLVLWHLEVGRLDQEVMRAVLNQPSYVKKLESEGKLECRYHLIGKHGGASGRRKADVPACSAERVEGLVRVIERVIGSPAAGDAAAVS